MTSQKQKQTTRTTEHTDINHYPLALYRVLCCQAVGLLSVIMYQQDQQNFLIISSQ
jgi:hypothetical protein